MRFCTVIWQLNFTMYTALSCGPREIIIKRTFTKILVVTKKLFDKSMRKREKYKYIKRNHAYNRIEREIEKNDEF